MKPSAFRHQVGEVSPAQPFADQLRALMELNNMSASDLARVADVELAACRALLDGAGTWASAVAVVRAFGGTLKISAPRRDRKGSIRNLAARAGLAPDTVMACQQFVSNPDPNSLIKIASLEAYVKVVGGRIWIE